MAKFELKLPKMGESVAEATITNWLKKVGDPIDADEAILEIATDKVDSEVPSEVAGVLTEVLFQINDIVKVGQTIAIIETQSESGSDEPNAEILAEVVKSIEIAKETVASAAVVFEKTDYNSSDKFYSPLVKNIASAEGITAAELDGILGSGKDGRVTKEDILKHHKSYYSKFIN